MGASDSGTASCSAVVAELMGDFGEGLPRALVAAEVLQAARELQGQVPDGSQEELLYRLAAHRITRLVART